MTLIARSLALSTRRLASRRESARPAFSASNGLSTASLFCWSSIFKREEPTRVSGKLLPVRVTSVDAKRAELELRLGVMRVRFEDGTSPRYVAELARALLDVASA